MTIRVWLIILVGVAAVIEDMGWRRISNWTSGGAVLAGLGWHFAQQGFTGAWHSFLGALIGFGVFLVFYLLGGMGGGDVKLMSGFGALLGMSQVLQAALWAAACGGIMAVMYLGYRSAMGRWRKTVLDPVSPAASKKISGECIPYAPAIAIGAWLTLISEM